MQKFKRTVTFITTLSSVLFRAERSTLGKNSSSLRIERSRKASSVVISSLACCPKLWNTRNHLSKTQAIANLRIFTYYSNLKRFSFWVSNNLQHILSSEKVMDETNPKPFTLSYTTKDKKERKCR